MSEQAQEKKRILVVEDDFFLRSIITQKLARSGFDVEGAGSATEAFQILESKPIHGVLLDLLLPGVNGKDILKRIKEDSRWASIPVIIASNLDNRDDRERAIQLGAADYLVKAQNTPDEIIARLRAVLEKSGISSSAAAA